MEAEINWITKKYGPRLLVIKSYGLFETVHLFDAEGKIDRHTIKLILNNYNIRLFPVGEEL